MGEQLKPFYEFGPFRLDPVERRLFRGDDPIEVKPKAFDALIVLVRNSGHLLTKDELMKAVWADAVVEENNLTQVIHSLRKALGDDRNGNEIIETVPRRGYRFVARVEERRSPGAFSQEPAFSRLQESPQKTGSSPQIAARSDKVSGATLEFGAGRTGNRSLARGALVGGVAVAGLALGLLYFRNLRSMQQVTARKDSGGNSFVQARRSVAVLGFRDLSGRSEQAWLATALAEMLTTELGAGHGLRTVPSDDVARMKTDLSLGRPEALSSDMLARIRKYLGADLVVEGSYTVLGKGPGARLRLDLVLRDAKSGEITAAISENGSEANLFDLVSDAGSRLRRELGVEEIPAAEVSRLRASAPSNPEAARLYSEGLERLRHFDALAARDFLEKAAAKDPAYPLSHLTLADCWMTLGYEAKASAEAKKAFDLSANLSREEQLVVEGAYRHAAHDWKAELDAYRRLFDFFPDNVDYGLKLARAQVDNSQGREALATLDKLRKLPPSLSDDPRIDMADAQAAGTLSDFKRVRTSAHTAADKAKAQGARLLYARARSMEGGSLTYLGDIDGAIAASEEAKAICAELGDKFCVAAILRRIGNIMVFSNPQEAEGTYKAELKITREIGNTREEGNILNGLQTALSFEGHLAEAGQVLDRYMALAREFDSAEGIVVGLNNTGQLLQFQGDLPGARKDHEKALALARQISQQEGIGFALSGIGDVERLEGALGDAQKHYEEAIGVFKAIGENGEVAEALFGLAEVRRYQGDLAGAQEQLERAKALIVELGPKFATGEDDSYFARLSMDQGQADRAEEFARRAAEAFRKAGRPDVEALSLAVLAESLFSQGKTSDAQPAIQRASELVNNSEVPFARLRVGITAARLKALSVNSSRRADLAEAARSLNAAAAQAAKYRFLGLRLEADLNQGEIEMRSGNAVAGRARLGAVEKEARAKGFGLIARKAAPVSAALERRLH